MNNLLYSDWFWACAMLAAFLLMVVGIVADIAKDRPEKGTGWRCSHDHKPMARRVRPENRKAL